MTSKKINLRLGSAEDIYPIADIYADSVAQLCKNDYTPEVIQYWKSSVPAEARLKSIENKTLWVAEVDGKIGGYLVSVPGELVALFVGSLFAGLGLGRLLGELGIAEASKNSCAEIRLESTLTAVPFYKNLGFREVSTGFFTHGDSDLKIPVVNMILSQDGFPKKN